MNYLLDTHTLIWFLENNKTLPDRSREVIEDDRNEVFCKYCRTLGDCY